MVQKQRHASCVAHAARMKSCAETELLCHGAEDSTTGWYFKVKRMLSEPDAWRISTCSYMFACKTCGLIDVACFPLNCPQLPHSQSPMLLACMPD